MKNLNVIGYGLSFMFGLVFGALLAVLLTPESGPEVRALIGEKAGAAGQQLRSGYERSRQWAENEAARLRKKQSPADVTDAASVE